MRPTVSDATEQLYASLGPLTLEDEAHDWHLLKFVDSLVSVLYADIFDLVTDKTRIGWADAFDPDTVPSWALRWLGQFVGVEPPQGTTDEKIREMLHTLPNFDRGTLASITSAAQLHLTGSKTVTITERDPDAYSLYIRVYNAQLESTCNAVLAEILKQKPAGIVLDFACVDGQNYNQLRDGDGGRTYDEVQATYPTYDDAIVPP
jgi:hypothetical protein